VTLSAHDVARELRRRLPAAGDVKIHKLLYYCQGWHATWVREPLFLDRIEAWTNGPVVAGLWADEKHQRPRPEPRAPSGEQLATIDYVVSRYGNLTGNQLIRLTHSEDPWREASEIEDPWASRDPEITVDNLVRWFSKDQDFRDREQAAAAARRQRPFDLTVDVVSDAELDAIRAVRRSPPRHDSRPA
jgi:uncharacterized phage-associated protein